jgi:hypothetical protein
MAQLTAMIADLEDRLSAAWTQGRTWRAERNDLREQLTSQNVNSSNVPTSPSCDPALSAAWAQARAWRAQRDALRQQMSAISGPSTGWDGVSPPGTPITPPSVSAAWAQGRTWRAERDAVRLELTQVRAEIAAAAALNSWGDIDGTAGWGTTSVSPSPVASYAN